MNAVSSPEASRGPEQNACVSANDRMAKDLVLGLQFCRANAMSLTRLQLALKTDDRQSALEAMDQLHELDAEIERLVRRYPASGSGPDCAAITKHLGEQKMSIAFEKLAFASGVQGPDLVSSPLAFSSADADENAPEPATWPNLPDIEPEQVDRFAWAKGKVLVLAIVAVTAIATVTGVMLGS